MCKDVHKIDQNDDMQIGMRIQSLRRQVGMNGAELGAILDISTNQVSRIDTGKARCKLEHIFMLCQIFECTSDYLLFGKKEEKHNYSAEQEELIEKLYATLKR